MTVLILGEPGSGKSETAEKRVMELSEGGSKLYIAAMIPFGEEGEERIKRHRRMRQGKGFLTVEWPTVLTERIREYSNLSETSCLLECLSNLAGNEMHAPGNRMLSTEEVADLVMEEVRFLCEHARHTVIVSNRFSEEEGMDEETLKYVHLTTILNDRLMDYVDRVEEIRKGEVEK